MSEIKDVAQDSEKAQDIMSSSGIRFMISEQFSGTKNCSDIFVEMILIKVKETDWTTGQHRGIITLPVTEIEDFERVPKNIVANAIMASPTVKS